MGLLHLPPKDGILPGSLNSASLLFQYSLLVPLCSRASALGLHDSSFPMVPTNPDHFVFVLAFCLYLVASTKCHDPAEQKSTLLALALQHTALGFNKGQSFVSINPSAESTQICFESDCEASHESGRLRQADVVKADIAKCLKGSAHKFSIGLWLNTYTKQANSESSFTEIRT